MRPRPERAPAGRGRPTTEALATFPDIVGGFAHDDDAAVIFAWQYAHVVATLPTEAAQRATLVRHARSLLGRRPTLAPLRLLWRRRGRRVAAQAAAAVAGALPWGPGEALERACALAMAAPWLSPDDLEASVVTALRSCPAAEQGTFWTFVAPYLPGDLVARASIAPQRGTTMAPSCGLPPLLVRLAEVDRTPEALRAAADLASPFRERALVSIALLRPDALDAPALTALVDRLATLPSGIEGKEDDGLLWSDDTALWRTSALGCLATSLPDTSLSAALHCVLVEDNDECAPALISLIGRAVTLQSPQAYALWETVRDDLTALPRSHLVQALGRCAPLLATMSDMDLLHVLDELLVVSATRWP